VRLLGEITGNEASGKFCLESQSSKISLEIGLDIELAGACCENDKNPHAFRLRNWGFTQFPAPVELQ
jgi:hypothetical protein